MISRQWRGVVKPSSAEAYISHLKSETFPHLARMAGFRGASILRRNVAAGIEFRIVTLWDSLEAIRQFAGDELNTAVVPDNAKALMVEYDGHVSHYEVVE